MYKFQTLNNLMKSIFEIYNLRNVCVFDIKMVWKTKMIYSATHVFPASICRENRENDWREIRGEENK